MLRDRMGEGVRLEGFEVMTDGHAGLTFGVDAVDGGQRLSLILKMAPSGVPLRGSTDVYRQARLLTELHASGLPVPHVVMASADDTEIGAPFIAMERLPGRSFVIWEPHETFSDDPDFMLGLWTQAAMMMGALHSFPWRPSLVDWEQPTTLRAELDRWQALLRHTEDPDWRRSAEDLYARLMATIPTEGDPSVIHGDFQPGNVLYHNGRASGLIDWDLGGIGAPGIDVGWLVMMADRDGWEAGWKPRGAPPIDRLLAAYRAGGGGVIDHLGWYRAFAHFRLGSIAGLNLKLHRSGRRVDAVWERFVPSILCLLRIAGDLIGKEKTE
ncbi:phosphotransferase family protein [Rhizorhabdus dicambivorans]|uniref:Phosphotransferase family protein n=1 Tax=Rhizorhabdus dicambivorans TaxID=1850238 RepID=A0A2A4FT36_9SPHN|nr:phosphotransferase family protein [Rhizorhabdus dicambivorans]ATE64712.1 phosphotransferase family protein [Rhizorhabdus dicambivorans]PCE41347.1 phosphotransferase family protein [Rhizorhabdus dicambivorans]